MYILYWRMYILGMMGHETGVEIGPESLACELLRGCSAVNNTLLSGWPCSMHLSHAYRLRERAVYRLEITDVIYVNIIVHERESCVREWGNFAEELTKI